MAKIDIDNSSIRITKYTSDDLKKSILLNANQMIDLNGKIDTENLMNNALRTLTEKKASESIKDFDDIKSFKEFAEKNILKDINDYIKYLKKLYDEDISNITADELKNKATEFNLKFLNVYVANITRNAVDLIDTSDDYASNLASVVADLQLYEIKKIGIDAFIKLDLDTDTSLKQLMQITSLKQAQKDIKNEVIDTSSDAITDAVLKTILFGNQLYDSLVQTANIIEHNKKYYQNIHKKYLTIKKLHKDIHNKYIDRDLEINKYATAITPKQPKQKPINLYGAKIFNNTYPLNRYTSIDQNNNGKYDIKLKITYENELKDLRDIIFVDDINKQQLSLLPIDLAIFVGFTTINNLNGSNIPITLSDAFKFISEDKSMRVRKNQKAYQLYDDKMQMFKSFKVKSIIKDRETKKTLIEFKDAIPILENYKVHIASKDDYGYIIGASAILSILNFLAEQQDTDYLTTLTTSQKYINDRQKNTIEILNMKYYLVIKVMQKNNAKNRGIEYQPYINLDDLYKQTAQLKGKTELNKTERARLRASINTYLEHLKDKNLLTSFDYKTIKEIGNKKKDNQLVDTKNASKNYIYIKI